MKLLFEGLRRHLENPQIVILFAVIIGILIVVVGFGAVLMPVLAGIVIVN
jgi:hypothetical protein